AQLEGLRRSTLADKVKVALDARLEDLSSLGKEYQKIRNSGESVTLRPRVKTDAFGRTEEVLSAPKSFLNERFGISFDESGRIARTSKGTPLSRGDKAALEEFLEVYGDLSTYEADEFLNARQALDKLSAFGKE